MTICNFTFLSKARLLLLMAIMTTTLINAQVTVGTNTAPEKGAILQLKNLKQETATGANADKGLGIPRVYINDLSSLNDISPTSTERPDPQKHIGLMVYNANKCIEEQGLFIWSGDEWSVLVDPKVNRHPAVKEMTDPRDGQMYLYREFGAAAGEWMVENLNYRDPSFLFNKYGDHDAPDKSTKQAIIYPFTSIRDSEVPSETWSKPYGLLYTFAAVTLGAKDAEYTDEGNKPDQAKLQGVCPPNWHVPSDYEWSQLEEELSKYPERYSSRTIPTQWEDTYYSATWMRPNQAVNGTPGHAGTMLSPCPPKITVTNPAEGFKAWGGGLSVLPAGMGGEGVNAGIGRLALFWTSSSGGTLGSDFGSYYRMMYANDYDDAGVYRMSHDEGGGTERYKLMSVRCKKD